jgi:hypothetical protein
MALWKHNLLTCVLAAAVALKIALLVRLWCYFQKQPSKLFSVTPGSNISKSLSLYLWYVYPGGVLENNIGNCGKHQKKGVKIKTQKQSY